MSGDRYDTKLVEPGSLVRPGWMGRFVRLLLGLALLKLFVDLFRYEVLTARGDTGLISSRAPDEVFFWVIALLLFSALPFVVNIGFGVRWRRWPQVVVLAAVAIAIGVSLVRTASIWSEALGWIVLVWLLYESLHLGVSFVLSAVLATPGCEMRALPHLWAVMRGERASEHYCPGFLDGLDRWEAGRHESREARS